MGVTGFAAFRAGLREIFLLREAERKSRSHGDRLDSIRKKKAEAASYLRAARRVARPDVAMSLLECAVSAAIGALALARGADMIDQHALLVAAGAPASAIAAYERRSEVELNRFADAESVRDEVERLVRYVLDHTEARTPSELRMLRYGRAAAILIAVGYFGATIVRDHLLVHNVALHKPVSTSPLRVNPPSGAEVVDGRTRGTFGVHTADGNPFVTVDLEHVYAVREVRIYNRGDGWFDDILPLTLSLSEDGVRFDDLATRTTHFDVWSVAVDGRSARYVRVSKPSGYIALNEIEVYARE